MTRREATGRALSTLSLLTRYSRLSAAKALKWEAGSLFLGYGSGLLACFWFRSLLFLAGELEDGIILSTRSNLKKNCRNILKNNWRNCETTERDTVLKHRSFCFCFLSGLYCWVTTPSLKTKALNRRLLPQYPRACLTKRYSM